MNYVHVHCIDVNLYIYGTRFCYYNAADNYNVHKLCTLYL